MVMKRRDFLATALAVPLPPGPAPSMLVHEHVLVDFRNRAEQLSGGYDAGAVFQIAKPHLEEIKRLGCVRFLDCTPEYIGRNPRLLRQLADATGLEIWTNTGWYAARDRRYLPPEASTETADQIARRWIAEIEKGVDGIKPRFIKTGVNRAPLHELDRKMVLAAAICSRATGATAVSHTGGGGPAALEQLEIFTGAKASAAKFVWVHADSEKDHAFHEKVARAGAWVEFDHVSETNSAFHLESVRFMASRGLLGQTLISQDAGYYRPGQPDGGPFKPYSYLYTGFLPKLDPAWVKPLLFDNPIAAFGGK
jgi:phosphotriesterase-related protein